MNKKELKLRYDEECKKILSYSKVLANILKVCINEYNNLSIEEIEELFEKDSNLNIMFRNDEDISIDNHKILYDIFFRSRLPNNDRIGILIDLESQSSINNPYPVINRAISYVSHLILSQTKKEHLYNDLDKVYSIWICSDTNKDSKTDIFTYTTKRTSVLNSKKLNEDYKLINIITIYLGKDIDMVISKGNSPYIKLLKLLRLLLLRGSKLDDPITQKTLKKEYNINIDRKDIKNMCNFSDAFEYDCIQQGITQGAIDAFTSSINSLIDNLKVSYKEAVNILGIDSSIRDEVLKAYKKKYKN